MENQSSSDSARVVAERKRILVADDAPVFRRALVRQLEVLGMDAHGVEDLETLEASLEGSPPGAVLLDWHFGGRTAEAVVELLRARWIPTIVLTGDPEGVAITGVPVLGKPVEFRLLRLQLAEVLSGAPQGHEQLSMAERSARGSRTVEE